MKTKTIRWVDINIGRPICWILTVWKNSFGWFSSRKKMQPQKILFIKFIEQGATVIAFSAIQKAIKRVGKENVYFCVFEPNRPILDLMGILPTENIIAINDNSLMSFTKSVLISITKIRRLKIDTTIDMEFFSRASAIFAYLSGAQNRVGLYRYTSEYGYRGRLMTHEVQHNAYLHTSKAYLMLVESLFENADNIPPLKISTNQLKTTVPHFQPNAHFASSFKEKLKDEAGGKLPNEVILINPNCGDMLPLRKWEEEKFIELTLKLIEQRKESLFVFTGAPEEAKLTMELLRKIDSKRVISMAGKTTLEELLYLFDLSSLLITNDSGQAHFASMTSTNVLVLFGPETPQLFGPIGEKVSVIWKGLACSPCINAVNHRLSPCSDNQCMKQISVEDVFVKSMDILENISQQLPKKINAIAE